MSTQPRCLKPKYPSRQEQFEKRIVQAARKVLGPSLDYPSCSGLCLHTDIYGPVWFDVQIELDVLIRYEDFGLADLFHKDGLSPGLRRMFDDFCVGAQGDGGRENAYLLSKAYYPRFVVLSHSYSDVSTRYVYVSEEFFTDSVRELWPDGVFVYAWADFLQYLSRRMDYGS